MRKEYGRRCWNSEKGYGMKKAVFIINSLQNGGAERVVATQANYLKEMGIDVTIIFLRKWMQYELHPGIHTIYLSRQKRFSRFSYIAGLPVLARRLNRVLEKVTRDGEIVLLTSHLLYPDVVARLTRYSSLIMAVLHDHQDIVPFSKSLPYKWFIRWLYGGRQIACVGSEIEKEMRDFYHLRQATIQPMWNPLDFKRIDEKKEEPLDFPRPYILYCARLTAVKHPERLLAAFYRGGFYKKYSLVFLGIGELEGSLKKMVREWNMQPYVRFGGWESNVYKWMKNASLLVLTSDVEGLPMVLLEALYCGCHVVAVRNSGSAQVMRGELRKYLCGSGVREIADKMEEALREYPEDLQRYTKDSAVEKVVENYMAVYKKWNDTKP